MSDTWADPGGRIVLEGTAHLSAGTPGAARVVGPFPLAYNTAGLAAGITIWTPAAGDIMLDAFVHVTTGFNGTTPKFDLCPAGMIATYQGLFYNDNNFVDVSATTQPEFFTPLGSLGAAYVNYSGPGGSGSVLSPWPQIMDGTAVKAWVTTSGASGGGAVGGSAGSLNVYLVMATPSLV